SSSEGPPTSEQNCFGTATPRCVVSARNRLPSAAASTSAHVLFILLPSADELRCRASARFVAASRYRPCASTSPAVHAATSASDPSPHAGSIGESMNGSFAVPTV